MTENSKNIERTGLEIAVTGMAGRFPKAKNLEEFWKNLTSGVEGVTFFTDSELLEYGVAPETLNDPNYVKAKPVLEDLELFDAQFFGYSHQDAVSMDPQIRILHETTWHALEDAGIDPETYDGRIGMYVGASSDAIWIAHSLNAGKMDNLAFFQSSLYSGKDLSGTLLSYRLNLDGPSYFIYTACSTSLATIHLACRGLLTGECYAAVAGGITVTLPKKSGYLCQEGMIYSADGHCRPFDVGANGTLFGDGVGLVVLKRLEDAVEDGDRIHAVIKASAANNDGRRKVGYVAPSAEGQADVIKTALDLAEVEPESIGYVETHGTGTLVGDPIEIEALNRAFNSKKKNFCGIGSVKSNLGHLHAAAGVAGFIKTVLALKHKQIPPTLNVDRPNPKIDFENSPFYINTGLREWKNNSYPLRAGVSAFGIGGTNVHMLLEEVPPVSARDKEQEREYKLILVSAKTETSLFLATENLTAYVKRNPDIDLHNVAYTLQTGRRAFQYRKMVVCADAGELVEQLPSADNTSFIEEKKIPIVFLFSGQGAQYVDMTRDIYRTEPVFREAMNRCFEILKPLTGSNIKEILYPLPGVNTSDKAYSETINRTEFAQSLLFAVGYSLSKLLIKWGITPYAMIGHSIGEYVAACLSGVFSLKDALALVALRGKLMQSMPRGSMLSVPLPEAEITPLLSEDTALAAVNGPSTCVVSGPHTAIDALENRLKEKGHDCKRLHTSHAFHSKMMDPILGEFEEKVRQISVKQPEIPYISNVSGNWITSDMVMDPAYWSGHLRNTVRFSQGIHTLLEGEALKKENAVFIQFGSDRSLGNLVNQHPGRKERNLVISLIRHPKDQVSDVRFLADKIGGLWLAGIKINWKAYNSESHPHILSLPGYAFEPTPYLSKPFYSHDIALTREEPPTAETKTAQIPADLKASPLLFQRPRLKTTYESPTNKIEETIAGIWQTIFGVEQVGIHDNFFDMGGDSLIAFRVVSLINKELQINVPVSEIFVNTTIARLGEYLAQNKDRAQRIVYPEKSPDPKNLHIPFPLTDIQLSYLLGRKDVFEMGGISTHTYQEMETQLDIGRLNQALNDVIKRHPMLRTVFPGERQMVLKEIPLYEIKVEDLAHLAPGAQQERILKERDRMSHDIFSPDRWPLFEIKAFKTAENTHYLCIGLDMLICDAASIGILARDMWAYYDGSESKPAELEFTFRDYMLAYEELRDTEFYARDKEYWLSKLETFPSSPALPLKCNPSEVEHPRFDRCQQEFSESRWSSLKNAAKSHGITPSALLATVYAEVLAYWSNQPHLAFNLTVFNRFPFHNDVNQILGDFTSVILLGIDLTSHDTFWEKASAVQKELLDALEHRHYDGVDFIRELSRHKNMAKQAVMPIVFTSVFSNEGADVSTLSRLGELKTGLSQTPQVFIDFQAAEMDGKLTINWDYVKDLFEADVIDTMFEQYIFILEEIITGNENFELKPSRNVLAQIENYNRTREDIPPATLHRMFMDQAKQTPENIALEHGTETVTYKELDERSNRVAHYLKEQGIERNDLIGVLSRRCTETIVYVMGILKSGGAYVPIDPEYPRDRRDYIFSSSNCRLMLEPQMYREKKLDSYPEGPVDNINTPDDLAYVIYTSGSTGRPKGVMETHREAGNTIIDINQKFEVNENDKILGISSMCFDLSVYDVFGSLGTGAALVIIDNQKDVKNIIETLYSKNITIWNSVPAIMDMVTENIDFYTLKTMDEKQEEEIPLPDDDIDIKATLSSGEKQLYFWSPSMYWKIHNNKLQIGNYYFSGVAPGIFPEFYFLTQEGIDINVLLDKFPAADPGDLKQFIDDLVKKRVLVNTLLPPEEVFRSQNPLFKNPYNETIRYVEASYNKYKKIQQTRTYEGTLKGTLQLEKAGEFPDFISKRRSYRSFEESRPIPFAIFSKLLAIFKHTSHDDVRYYYASAGGLYPIDVFIYVKKGRVENLPQGIYYYSPVDNSLNLVNDQAVITEDAHFMGNKEIFTSSAFSIFMIYNARANMPKYSGNGYLLSLIDTGIMVGTLTQAAELTGIGLCSVGAMNFDRIRDSFKLNDSQVLIHIVEMGMKPGIRYNEEELSDTNQTAIPQQTDLKREAFGKNQSLRLVLMSGDWIPLPLPGKIRKYFPTAKSISLGGATEGSIWSIYYPINEVNDSWKSIPYGYPLANQVFYVLDFEGRYCPVNVPGELHIGGAGVAEGYMADEEKTKKAFIFHHTLGRLYKTGDFGVFRKEGYIEFLGRRDSQVKIRGYRIELGEIETRLLEIDMVKDAVVIVKEKGKNKTLCAFIVPASPVDEPNWPQAIDNIRKQAAGKLPEYMIPTSFIRLNALPVTATGKIDRKCLSQYEIVVEDDDRYEAPGTLMEETLAEIFKRVLNVERVGINDSFFQLGGDSLKAITIVTEIRKAFNADIPLIEIFSDASVKEIAEYLHNEFEALPTENKKLTSRAKYPRKEPDRENLHLPFGLTDIQRAYLMGRSSLFDMGGTSTHLYQEIEAHVDIQRLNHSIDKIIRRHPMMRAVFTDDGRQKILEDIPQYRIPVEDATHLDSEKQQRLIEKERERMSHHIFDIEQWPLFEIKAVKRAENDYYLFIGFDLLVGDAASVILISSELVAFYENPQLELPPLEFSFRDYLTALGSLKESEIYFADKQYWMSKLEDFPPAPQLPLKCSPSDIDSPRFKRLMNRFEAGEWNAFKEIAKKHMITPTAFLCTAYLEVLSYWSNQPRLAINLPVFNRFPFHDDVNKLVGDFTSIILLNVDLREGRTFREKAAKVQDVILESLEHRHFDGVEFIREISRDKNMGTQAVMPIIFTSILFDHEGQDNEEENQIGEVKMGISQTSQVFIDFQANEEGGTLSVNWDYVEELFEARVIDCMFDQFKKIVRAISRDEADVVLEPEKNDRIQIENYNKTAEDIPPTLLHEMFTRRAALSPQLPAVEFLREKVTYQELNRRSNRVAHYLKEQGIGRNDLVGVMGDRRIETIVYVMGILKAGGAYVPVDPDFPEDRRNYIYRNSNCKLVVETGMYQSKQLDKYPDTEIPNINSPDDLAYVIYTSGSTGRPKGVIETHRAAANTIQDINRKFYVNENDKVLGISSMCFDLSVYDIFGALGVGAALVLIKDQKDIPHLVETLEDKKITLWNSVPAIMDLAVNFIIENRPADYTYSHLRLVLLSGDWIPLALPVKIKKSFPAAQSISLGGATEASIWSIHYPIEKGEVKDTWKSIPYGMPLANQTFHVLNYRLQTCPADVPGELYIGGDGLASGYLNDVDKTHYHFIHHPELGNLYRTGDYGVFHKEGHIEFLGRRDQQVKIKGYRIELGEIENQLLGKDGVKEAIVIVKQQENGDRYLCAYITAPGAGDGFAQGLRTNLSRLLPAYMIPSYFILLDKIPLTANGKVNRKELPEPGEVRKEAREEKTYTEPATEIEKTITDICIDVVQIERIGVDDNFFDLGITSLDVAKINRKIRDTFKIHLPIIKMFEFSTVSSLADHISIELENSDNPVQEDGITQKAAIDAGQARTIDKGRDRLKQRRRKDKK